MDPKKEIWPYLLGVFEPGTTPETRAQQLQQFQTKYQALLEVGPAVESTLRARLKGCALRPLQACMRGKGHHHAPLLQTATTHALLPHMH